MAGFPPLNIPKPPSGNGVPQYFSSATDPHSFFPGVPQFNFTMQRMLDQFGSLDPELQGLLSGYEQYGKTAQQNVLRQGRVGATGAMDAAAGRFDPSEGMGKSLRSGISSGSDEPGIVDYAAKQIGTQAGKSQAQGQAAQIPGQTTLMQQHLKNAFVQQKLKSLSDMIGLAASAAGGNYGYQAAQLGADAGQIALANAQDREAAANLQSMMGLIMEGPVSLMSPSSFYGPGAGGQGQQGPGWGGLQSMLQSWLNPGAAAGAGSSFGGFLPADSGQFLGSTAGMAGNAGAAGSAGFMDALAL